jgi:uncharacterized integral membrane protein (TIGR00697 family)
MEKNTIYEKKRQQLFLVLMAIFLTNALVAEMIGIKIFSVENTLGFAPANLSILGFTMNFNLTAGVMLWPIVFITSDLINEYFGKEGVKRISYLTMALIAYTFVILFITILLEPADWWVEAEDDHGNVINMQLAYEKIFGQSQRIIVGSLVAFMIGQLVDVYVFQKLRKITGSKMLWLRATGSTLVSQLIDSYVVLFIAFYGTFENQQIIAIGITNYLYKFMIAIALTPVLYIGHHFIDRYLGKHYAEKIAEEAAKKSEGFF